MTSLSEIVVQEVEVNSILLKSKQPDFDFVLNPYTGCPMPCKYCYASFMRRFSKHKEGWGEFLDVKRSRQNLDVGRLVGKRILISSVTEPYNSFEKRFKATREVLKQLCNVDCEVSICTKSALVLRDLDLLKKMKNVEVIISLCTLDEALAADLEPSYPVGERLDALQKLHAAGIKTAVSISPILPYLTDPIEIVRRTMPFADRFIFESLTLRNEFKPAMLNYIWQKFPQHLDGYNKIYRDGDRGYYIQIFENLQVFCDKNGIKCEKLLKLN